MEQQNMIEIGEGGFGIVFCLANYNPRIVMKIARNERVDEQRKELDILKELIHVNIVKYLDRPPDFEHHGTGFPIFMEHCEWGSMRKVLIDSEIKYSVATIVKWGREIFSALVYLTQKHIVHHDIKLDNIFMAKDFAAKIGDFGVMKRFGSYENQGNLLGTWIYMAPEYRGGRLLDEQDSYKCDVFGAGLALFELLERRSLTTTIEAIHLTPTKCADVARLHQLVVRCSCPMISIEKRFTAAEAFEEIKCLQQLFTNFDVEPEIRRGHTLHCKPDGLCLAETGFPDTFMPPNATFFTKPQTDNVLLELKKLGESPHGDRFTCELLPKVQRKTEFFDLWINGELRDHNSCSTLNFRLLKEAMNVNEAREIISEEFFSRFTNLDSDHQVQMIEQMEKLLALYFREDPFIESPLYFDDKWMEREFEQETWKELLSYWRRLIVFDFRLQHFTMLFGLQALYHSSSVQLSWMERLRLLNLAIHNIEQMEKIFTKRIRYRAQTFDDFSTEWCFFENLVFKKDLSDFRFSRHGEFDKGSFEKRAIIDLEAVRRALHLKRVAAIENAQQSNAKQSKNTIGLQQYLDYINNHPPPGYFDDHQVPSEPEIIQEALALPDTQFPGYVFNFELQLGEIFPACECEPKCGLAKFPTDAPTDELCIEYSMCSTMGQQDFLETHSLFERSFRILNFWPKLFSFQYTSFVLLTELLEEITRKNDPSYGFAFMFMKETGRSAEDLIRNLQRTLKTEARPNNGLKTGILISFDQKEKNSLLTRTFGFESAFRENLWLEFIGLIYVNLSEISELLQIMMRHLLKLLKYKSQIQFDASRSDEHRYVEKLEMAYMTEMQDAIEAFWRSRDEELKAKVKLKAQKTKRREARQAIEERDHDGILARIQRIISNPPRFDIPPS